MPKAKAGYAAPTARVPRTIFGHAHKDGSTQFPPNLVTATTGEIFLLMPDNFNGLSAFYLWFFSPGAGNVTMDIIVNIGTTGEVFNTHTQTVLGNVVPRVANEYVRFDLTAIFAVVLANLQSEDMMWIVVTQDGDSDVFLIGGEIQES